MDIIYLATFLVAFISSILSGVAGGGGGFVMSPYWLVLGMTPAQGAAAGSFMATGTSVSSTVVLHKTDHFPKSKRLLYILSITAFIGSILGAVIVPKIDMQSFRYLLAIITVSALPLLFVKPAVNRRLSRYRALGLVLAILLLIIGSIITSSALSILFALVLMSFFDMSVLQITALRRLVGVTQSIVMFVAFTAQGYFIWQHAIAGLVGGSLGSYIGTKYAVKKGELFAKYALAIMSLIGAVALLF
jgi:uncharacterized membrane protein YfcA